MSRRGNFLILWRPCSLPLFAICVWKTVHPQGWWTVTKRSLLGLVCLGYTCFSKASTLWCHVMKIMNAWLTKRPWFVTTKVKQPFAQQPQTLSMDSNVGRESLGIHWFFFKSCLSKPTSQIISALVEEISSTGVDPLPHFDTGSGLFFQKFTRSCGPQTPPWRLIVVAACRPSGQVAHHVLGLARWAPRCHRMTDAPQWLCGSANSFSRSLEPRHFSEGQPPWS